MKRITPVQAGVPGVEQSMIDAVLLAGLNELYLNNTKVRLVARLALLEYLFGMLKAVEFDRVIKEMTEDKLIGRSIRSTLANNGYVLCNVKLFTYGLVCNQQTTRAEYKVLPKDASIIKQCLKKSPNLLAYLRGLRRKGLKPWTLETMMNTIDSILVNPGFKTWMAKFTYRKLRFVYESQSSEPQDLAQEFCTVATYAILKQYPRILSPLHAMNIAKTTVHNRGQNMIKDAAAPNKARLIANGDGTFSSRMIPLHSIPGSTWTGDSQEGVSAQTNFSQLVVGIDGSSASGKTPKEIERSLSLSRTFHSLYGGYSDKEKQLLELWMGEHDEGFSEYLGEDNEVLAQNSMKDLSARKKYLRKCAAYLEIDREKVNEIYSRLRESLSQFR